MGRRESGVSGGSWEREREAAFYNFKRFMEITNKPSHEVFEVKRGVHLFWGSGLRHS